MISFDNAIRLAISLTLLFIGFQMGTIWGAQPGVEAWVYKWQTLFTGLMAVGAAVLTVLAMYRTDTKQQDRHDEIYALTLRRDILAVQRAAHMGRFYRELAADIQSTADRVKDRLATNSSRPPDQDVLDLLSLGSRFNVAIKMTPVRSAEALFGPRMAQIFEALGYALPGVEAEVGELRSKKAAHGTTADIEFRLEVKGFIDEIVNYAAPLSEFADCLAALNETYKKLHRPPSSS